MKAYEYYAEMLPDGHLSIPQSLKDKLKEDSRIRVMVFIEDEEVDWEGLTNREFLKGYSDKDSIYDNL
ncbi:MAG: hypothetical protein NTY44_00765 [Deltaproteobacteria bacterium]|mgnify:CR=1 FL=1|jgi:hypothetical protein|nr:hypothetical protein [Deltaproteobacteria bacterium]